MFRKLTDRITTAASAVAASAGLNDSRVAALTSMGFDEATATQALQATNGNVDRAAELLLASSSDTMNLAAGTQSSPIAIDDDDDAKVIQQVMEESRLLAAASAQQPTIRSAASIKAGQAATSRAKSPMEFMKPSSLTVTHPAAKILPKLQNKPTEEQILRCADRLKSFPTAVDTLHRALSLIQANPDESKYRKIDKSLPSYQRSLANATGADDFWRAMQFRPQQGRSTLVLERHLVDPALLYLGISALEQTKLTPEYKQIKQRQVFAKEVSQILVGSDSSETEAIARANYISKCPTEPSEGRGALMSVLLSEQMLRRRFDGDDTLADVIHWLGGHGSTIPIKLANREWCLVDKNKYPLSCLDCSDSNQRHTLQYLGCWPSGMLEILPTLDE